jgi:hypothetical protein
MEQNQSNEIILSTDDKIKEAIEFLDNTFSTAASEYIKIREEICTLSPEKEIPVDKRDAIFKHYAKLVDDSQITYIKNLDMLLNFIKWRHEAAVNLSKYHEAYVAALIAQNNRADELLAKAKSDTAMPEVSTTEASTDGL